MAKAIRLFGDILGDTAVITGDEYRHAVSVMRARCGDAVCVLNDTLKEYIGEITQITKTEITVKITEIIENTKESRKKILLICGFLKGDKTELIVQKATELGVSEIVVFESKNSSAYISDAKLLRLEKVAREAAKQCGRSITPKISGADFESALSTGEGFANKLFACEFAENSETDILKLSGDCAIVVGSEGGFTQEEFISAKAKGYKALSLGKRILRAETAAIALVAIAACVNGDLK